MVQDKTRNFRNPGKDCVSPILIDAARLKKGVVAENFKQKSAKISFPAHLPPSKCIVIKTFT